MRSVFRRKNIQPYFELLNMYFSGVKKRNYGKKETAHFSD